MAEDKKKAWSIFNGLKRTLNGWTNGDYTTNIKKDTTIQPINKEPEVLLRTTDRTEYEVAKVEEKQNKYLRGSWKNAIQRTNIKEVQSMNLIELMYRDCELMSNRPEIYQALTVIANEACTLGPNGSLLNVNSTSPRIKSILEDLFVNRLQIHMELLPVCRTMLKYGNCFQLLNIQSKNGVLGWKMLPVAEVKRFTGNYPYSATGFIVQNSSNSENIEETHFEFVGAGGQQKYQGWQMAHFRLLNDAIALPYGASLLNGARQQWRRLTMMEDHALIYMMQKAYERFVYKIDIRALDQADVEPMMKEIMNNFKRTYKIDKQTGMLDLQENFLACVDDLFIPIRGNEDATKIETLSAGANFDKIKDLIEYVHLQMLTALGIPKPYLNYEASPAEGRTLSMADIRFAKLVTRIQQCLIMELNKIAIIHLYLMGFTDDLNNFTLTMNSPSTQAEIQRIEEMQKKILACKDAVGAATDSGLPIYSWKKALKDIMKFSDAEIQEILEDIRLEKAFSTEITLTQQIIKKTGLFDKVDNLYGEPDAEYDYSVTELGQAESQGGGGGGGGGGAMGDADFGGGDEAGGEMGGEEAGGAEGGDAEAGAIPAAENRRRDKKPLITENVVTQFVNTIQDDIILNESFDKMIKDMDAFLEKME
jgi:hypothetical protein